MSFTLSSNLFPNHSRTQKYPKIKTDFIIQIDEYVRITNQILNQFCGNKLVQVDQNDYQLKMFTQK
jgi:hypothetical protein